MRNLKLPNSVINFKPILSKHVYSADAHCSKALCYKVFEQKLFKKLTKKRKDVAEVRPADSKSIKRYSKFLLKEL